MSLHFLPLHCRFSSLSLKTFYSYSFPFSFPLSGSLHVLPVHFPCISVSLQCPLHFRAIPLTSIFQTFSIHFHSPFPSFPHTSLTGVDSTPLHRLHHPKQCPPWMLNCCTLLQSFFHSFHQCIFQELSINCPHIFHPSPFPPFPAFVSSTPIHFHQFCILFVHPFSSPFHPAISHELFIRIPFPFRSRCPVLHVLPVHFPASRFLSSALLISR